LRIGAAHSAIDAIRAHEQIARRALHRNVVHIGFEAHVDADLGGAPLQNV